MVNYVNSAQIGFNEFKDFVIKEISAHPITAIFLVAIPFFGITALCVWGIRKAFLKSDSTAEKVDTAVQPLLKNTDVKHAENAKPADTNLVDQKTIQHQSELPMPKLSPNLMIGLKIAGLAFNCFIIYKTYQYGPPAIISESYYGYTEWAKSTALTTSSIIPNDLVTNATNTATQCLKGSYSLFERGVTFWEPIKCLFYYQQIKGLTLGLTSSVKNLVLPAEDSVKLPTTPNVQLTKYDSENQITHLVA